MGYQAIMKPLTTIEMAFPQDSVPTRSLQANLKNNFGQTLQHSSRPARASIIKLLKSIIAMKTKHHLTYFTALFLFTVQGLFGQITPTGFAETNASDSNQVQVSNTGNDVVEFMGLPLKISVWDGQTPSLHWDFNNGAVTGESQLQTSFTFVPDIPFDPDVVINRTGTGEFIIVYQWSGRIFFEAWRFNGVTCIPVESPTVVSSGAGFAKSPDIDQSDVTGAMVWEENHKIYGRTINMSTYAMGPEVQFGTCLSGQNREPDVAVYDNGSERIASVVFINKFAGTTELIYQRHDLTAFEGGDPTTCTPPLFWVLKSLPSGSWSGFKKPRIAATPYHVTLAHDYRDCQIVATELYPGGYTKVVGFNHDEDVHGGEDFNMVTYTDAPSVDLQDCFNLFPVVSYVNCQRIMIEWFYHPGGSGPCLPITGWHIIGRQLDMSGLPIYDDYAQISVNNGLAYATPSVSGRFLAGTFSSQSIFSTYSEALAFDIYYKNSDCTMPGMKAHTTATLEQTQVEVFPNPFSNRLNIKFDSELLPTSIDILNVKGQLLKHWTDLDENMLELSWDTEDLPQGMYLVRMQYEGWSTTQKVMKQ